MLGLGTHVGAGVGFVTDWMDDVPCRERPGLYFSYSPSAQEAAAGICRNECPSLVECEAWAIRHGDLTRDGRAVHGVIAGVVPPTKKPARGLRRCELASCGALFDEGHAGRRYCTEECSSLAHAAQQRAWHARQRGVA